MPRMTVGGIRDHVDGPRGSYRRIANDLQAHGCATLRVSFTTSGSPGALPPAAAVVDELADALGGVNVLVNNAGTGTRTPLLDLDYDTWREVPATDLDAAFLCLQRAARRRVAAGCGGRSVNAADWP